MSGIKKNFGYNMIYQVLMLILPLITAPYVSRALGVEGVGTYSYVHSIAYYFALCGMLGVSNHGNRSIAALRHDKAKMSKEFCNIFTIQLFTSAIASLIYFIYIFFFFEGDKLVAYLCSFYILSFVVDINWFYFGLEKFKLTVTRNIVIKLLTTICIFIFVKDSNDLLEYTLILSLGMFLSQSFVWIYMKKYISFVKPSISEIKKHIKPMLVLFIPVLAYSVYKVMDKIMLGSMTTVYQVGLYENADRIVNIPVSVITAFGTVMMPRISSLIAEGQTERLKYYMKSSFQFITMIASSMVFGLMAVGSILAPVYFGKEFMESGALICLLSVTVIFLSWANVIRTQHLIPNHMDRPYVLSTILGAVVNLAVNLTLIPRFYAVGACIGTICAEFTVMLVQSIYVRKQIPLLAYAKSSMIFILFGFIMFVPTRYIGYMMGVELSTLVLQLVVGTTIYLMLSSLYLYKVKNEVFMSLFTKIPFLKKSVGL